MHSSGMNNTALNRYFIILLAFAAFSCGYDDEVPAIVDGKEYVPLSVGAKRTYRVTDTTYTGVNTFTTSTYWMQETVTEEFTDLEGRPSYKTVRSKLQDTTNLSGWQTDSIIVYTLTSNRLERVQNNNRIIDLTFPAKVGNSWDPNLLNVNHPAEETYSYQEVGKPATVKGKQYENTLLVKQDNSTPLLFDITTSDRYAIGIGLVERLRYRVGYQVEEGNLTGDRSNGYITYQTLIENP
jgi:hypothetical protein